MANQPSKYSKFLVGAASAALVASAVAPVASAADFKDTKGNTHEAAIDALSDAGVIKGYSDGTFLPNKTLTRSDVVKMMGKWLVTEGHAIPADARTNPRFTDLSTKSNAELLDYAAVVKDAGVFIGSNGKLLAVDNITRENMALVLVRAFDTVEKIDLATYVAGQDFKRDVKDLTSAKSEARAAIDVLDFFDITNPTVATFNPKGNTTRGHFATFLHKTINADFSKVSGEAAKGVESVKAVNATTVEVTFKEDVKDVKTSDYTIEGLAISNAAIKQTNSKVVVLTTAVQTGDKEYTLKSGESALGKFKGISGVIPTKITMNTASTQGVVGKEVTLKADIGVKEAGVPVTFNVAAGSKLNKDHIEEVTTDANGIATYSYTQYVSGEKDEVVAYPTGAPSVRSLATVYWGVDTILTVTPSDDKQGNSVANGANKVYKVTYKNPKTGAAVANQRLHVTFAENVNVTIDKVSKATVNGTNPMQLSNGTTPVTAEVITDSKGEATFTVSGHNTTVTPVVFPNEVVVNNNYNNSTSTSDVKTWDATKLQAQVADKLVFGATQADYVIDITRDGGEEAARFEANGREYKVVLKTKDGKVAANELVNIAFNEDVDRNINTNTSAYFTKDDKKILVDGKTVSQTTVKTDAKGEATFTISSDELKDYATPVAWIDVNTSNAKEGKFDDGEPNKVAPISYFADAALTGGTVKAYNDAVSTTKAIKEFTGLETATFKFTAANQSGQQMGLPTGYSHIEASFTVFNTGSEDITVDGHTVSPNRSHTTTTIESTTSKLAQIEVKSVNNKTASVRVVANGTAIPLASTNNRAINLGSHTSEVTFKSTTDVGELHTGLITSINKEDKKIQFEGKTSVSYKGASFKNHSGNTISQETFESTIKEALDAGLTHRVTLSKDGDKITVSILTSTPVTAPTSVLNLRDVTAVVNSVVIPTDAQVPGKTFGLTPDANGVVVDWTSSSSLLTIASDVATVGAVDKEQEVTLTATFTKGTGADQAKVTKNYTVKVAPTAAKTKADLLRVLDEAVAKEADVKYTEASRKLLTDARYEAKVVYDNNSATPAEVTAAVKGLQSAIDKLVTHTTVTGKLTVAPNAVAVNGTVKVTVTDADLNVDSAKADTVIVTVGSANLTLTETGNSTGIFEGTTAALATAGPVVITYTDAKDATGKELKVTETITVTTP
ncbi:S-layer homology domain-containing protein [Sporosarcina sp. ANT_H38]|uniref:S-layer homology domain-containing protein n=1 Tax=Sporosarcina sp. ANT_H38 TaxID=2597358 RepID=UPI0011F3406E|nr:S-layer homology domain-containing protein [Sporosarcina sp. ANT_H38]KAA0955606.1 S-layer homology domain-containing protein [Sporosarcina sp. ANT_H38]